MLVKGNVNLAFNWFKWKLAHSHFEAKLRNSEESRRQLLQFGFGTKTNALAIFNTTAAIAVSVIAFLCCSVGCVCLVIPPLLLRQWWIRATLMTIIISDSRGKGWAKGASASSLDTRLCHCSDSHCSSLAYPLILETATAHSHALTPEWWSSSLSLFASSMVVVVCICLEVFLAADFLVDVGVA